MIKDGEIVIDVSGKKVHVIIGKIRMGRSMNLIDNCQNIVSPERVVLPNIDYFCKSEDGHKVYRVHFKDDDTVYSVTSNGYKYIGQRIGYSTNALGVRCKAPGIDMAAKSKIKELIQYRLDAYQYMPESH